MKLTSLSLNSGIFRLKLMSNPIYYPVYYGSDFLAIKSLQIIDSGIDYLDFIDVEGMVKDSLFQEVYSGKQI